MEYSQKERIFLGCLGVIGLAGALLFAYGVIVNLNGIGSPFLIMLIMLALMFMVRISIKSIVHAVGGQWD